MIGKLKQFRRVATRYDKLDAYIERLWQSIKNECVYLHVFKTGCEARAGIDRWIDYYNDERLHSALGGRTPAKVYDGTRDQIRLVA